MNFDILDVFQCSSVIILPFTKIVPYLDTIYPSDNLLIWLLCCFGMALVVFESLPNLWYDKMKNLRI